jgi:predicted  nucleic acid-binding Zn-ribbon protein
MKVEKSEGYKFLIEVQEGIEQLINSISETQAEHVDRHMLNEWSDELKYLVSGKDRSLPKAMDEYETLFNERNELEQEKSSLEDNLTGLYEANDNLTSIIDDLEHRVEDLQKEVNNYKTILNNA